MRISSLRSLGVAGAIALSLCAAVPEASAFTLPDCAGPLEARDVRIIRVEQDGDLILEDGRAVLLEGLVLPRGAPDHAPSFYADQAISVLRDLAADRHVALSMVEPKEDRWGRLRAQVFFPRAKGEAWLQLAMLRRGMARVSMAPDRGECAKPLYAAEAQARQAHTGLWTSEAYALRAPDDLSGTIGTFQIVRGKVLSATIRNERAYLLFGPDRRHDFKVVIDPQDLRRFRDDGVDPRDYSGMMLRVRGYVDHPDAPEIEVASPTAIEVVDAP